MCGIEWRAEELYSLGSYTKLMRLALVGPLLPCPTLGLSGHFLWSPLSSTAPLMTLKENRVPVLPLLGLCYCTVVTCLLTLHNS